MSFFYYDVIIKIGDYMRYLVRVGNLKQKVSFLENELKNIDDNINKLKLAKMELNWEGEARNTFNVIYDNYIEELMDLERKILSYIKFLTLYYDKYGNEYNLLRKKFLNLLDTDVIYDLD